MRRTAMSILATSIMTVALAQAVWRLYPPPGPVSVAAATAAEVWELRAAIQQLNERYDGLSRTVKEAVQKVDELGKLTAREPIAGPVEPRRR